jgi:hypothetical protein
MKKDTAFTRALGEQNIIGGRYRTISRTTVTAGSSPAYPEQPPGSPWHHDPLPPEPPIDGTDCGSTFGVAIGEPHESGARDGTADWPPSDASPSGGPQCSSAIQPPGAVETGPPFSNSKRRKLKR